MSRNRYALTNTSAVTASGCSSQAMPGLGTLPLLQTRVGEHNGRHGELGSEDRAMHLPRKHPGQGGAARSDPSGGTRGGCRAHKALPTTEGATSTAGVLRENRSAVQAHPDTQNPVKMPAEERQACSHEHEDAGSVSLLLGCCAAARENPAPSCAAGHRTCPKWCSSGSVLTCLLAWGGLD